MSCTPVPSSSVVVGFADETSCNELVVAGTYSRLVSTDGVEFSPVGNLITASEVSGVGATAANAQTLVSADASFTVNSRDGGPHRNLIARQLRRAAFPADVVVSATCDFLPTGTHQDGRTGPQIRAANGAFANFISYDGGKGIDHLLIWVSGAATADDKGPRGVYRAWTNGATDDYIDLMHGWNAGKAGAGASRHLDAALGSPISTDTGQPLTITVDAQIKEAASGGPSLSLLKEMSDAEGNIYGYEALTGWRGNGMTVSFSGKEWVTIAHTGFGHKLYPLSAVNPASPATIDTAIPTSRHHSSANNLIGIVVANNKDSKTLVLSSALATGFTLTHSGNSSRNDDGAGDYDPLGVVTGNHSVTIEVPLTLRGTTEFRDLYTDLQSMGFEATEADADVTLLLSDTTTGNVVVWRVNRGTVDLDNPTTGGDGTPVTSTFRCSGAVVDQNARMIVYGELSGVAKTS
jgi:hypothetical protein